ncbi:MAG TPA: type II secretion system protein, partial [Candidatus Omnitrophota bacterium]|nr:type II secretion system protein [Candidatus Omnitrophota bacterium]
MKSDSRAGYTMIELIAIMLVVAVLSVSFASYIMSAMNAWIFVKSRETALSDARQSTERIVRELRRISDDAGLITAATTECKFINSASATIDVVQSGNNLMINGNAMVSGIPTVEGLRF